MKNIKDLTADDRAAQWLEIATLIDENFTEVNDKPGKVDPNSNGTGEIFNDYSHNIAGVFAHAEGLFTEASDYSHAEGSGSKALGVASHTEGLHSMANGYGSHAEGFYGQTFQPGEHAEGYYNKSINSTSPNERIIHSVGIGASDSDRKNAHEIKFNGDHYVYGIGGYNGINSNKSKTLQEIINNSAGKIDTTSDGTGEIFNNDSNVASGRFSHAEGQNTTASGTGAHAEGQRTTAGGNYSHAEGQNTTASGINSHAEGQNTTASGINSHSEGQRTTAGGNYSHAEGQNTTASGTNSHAEGQNTTASGTNSHAEGNSTAASGTNSHADGYGSIASANFSHASNRGAIADNYAQTSIGYFNEIDSEASPTAYKNTKPAFLIGNGQNDTSRGNAFKVLFNGQTYADGEYSSAGADYAECFEWEDGNPANDDRVGLFVSLNNDKIQLADENSNYILGVVSGAPTIIGDNPMRWHNKYLNDKWGRPIYEDIEISYKEIEIDEKGNFIEVEKTRIDHIRKLNPDYNPGKKYIPRAERKEWNYIGMMGKLLVKQDGTLISGGFCKPINGGLATKSENGYYVMKVIDDEQALILLK